MLFLGITNDMFAEIINENISTQKIISFLQSTLLKQKDLQQYLRFKPLGSATALMEECFYGLLRELDHKDAGSRFICKGLLIRIFRLLSTQYEFTLSQELRRTMNWMVFEEISDYIHAHYATVTIRGLSEIFHFQEDYFNRLIKDKTGLTYSEYVQQTRLSKAEYLLLNPDRKVDDVMEAVGYQNKGFFYKIFARKYGTTPSKYRKARTHKTQC